MTENLEKVRDLNEVFQKLWHKIDPESGRNREMDN